MTSPGANFFEKFVEALPHARALGLKLVSIGAGRAEMHLPYNEAFIGDPETGVLHGGAVFALIDTCAGGAVLTHPSGLISAATLDLRVEYMRSAEPGRPVMALAECHHVTQAVAFARVRAHDGDPDDPVALASGTFTIDRKSEPRP